MLPVSLYVNYRYIGVTPVSHLKILIAPLICGVITALSVVALHAMPFFKQITPGWQLFSIDALVTVVVFVSVLWLFFRSIFIDLQKLLSLAGFGRFIPWKLK
jgi:hypothetical protein